MARMIPACGPNETNSNGEKRIYSLLKSGLSDDFIVIHSLPWLARSVKQIDKNYAPTGEIDFLIIHPNLGLPSSTPNPKNHSFLDIGFI